MLSSIGFVPCGCMAEQPLASELSSEEIQQIMQQQQAQAALEQQQQHQSKPSNGESGKDAQMRDDDSHSNTSDSDNDNDDDANETHTAATIHQTSNSDSASDSSADDAMTDSGTATANDAATAAETQLMSELNMSSYDDEADGASLFLGGRNLTVHESNADDPYLAIGDSDDDASDGEDTLIKDSDYVLLCARTEDEHSSLEVQVYDPVEASLYIHHDFVLPSFPLCHAWIGADVRSEAQKADVRLSAQDDAAYAQVEAHPSFVAIGTFQCGIEVWNLNVMDVLEPSLTLGGRNDVTDNQIAAAQAKQAQLKS